MTLEEYILGFQDSVSHYCSLETAIKILASNEVRLSPMSRMNDPWESVSRDFGSFKPSTEYGQEMFAVSALLPKAIQSHVKLFCCSDNWVRPKFENAIANPWHTPNFFDDPSDCFLSPELDSRFLNQAPDYQPTDNRIWQRMRMWDQYADKRRGACLVFDRQEFAARLHGDFPFSAAGHVFYASLAQRIYTNQATAFDPDVPEGTSNDQAIRHHLNRYIKDLFLIKDLDWANENEFRFIAFENGTENWISVNFGEALKAVILGMSFESTMLPSVIHYSKAIPIYRSKWDTNLGTLKLEAVIGNGK